MDSMLIFSLMMACFAILMVIGTPIFAALGFAGISGMLMTSGLGRLDVIPVTSHRGMACYSPIAMPLFILMGEVIARTSIGGKLYQLYYLWVTRLPGGL